MIRIRRCTVPLGGLELERVLDLHAKCMPNDKLYPTDRAHWWLAYSDGEPIGYAAARDYGELNAAFFVAAGVLPLWRGVGIHGRMIRARLRWARANGFGRVVTYTMLDNVKSANALIHAGFRKTVNWEYVGNDVDYWERAL